LIIVVSVLSIIASAHNPDAVRKYKERKTVNGEFIVPPNENKDSKEEDIIPTLKPLSIPTNSALIKPLIAVLLFDEEYGHCYVCNHGHSLCVPTEPGKDDCMLDHQGPNCVGDSNGG
jgi:hypothetical protein